MSDQSTRVNRATKRHRDSVHRMDRTQAHNGVSRVRARFPRTDWV